MTNQERLDKEIIRQKKMIASLFHNHSDIKDFEEIGERLGKLKKSCSEICLVVANFKCQKCLSEENLQYHHLIPKRAKEYMDKIRYISARYYWGNIIILCKGCHSEYHTFNKKDTEEMGVITQKKIDKIKKKYAIEDGTKI